MSKRKPIDKTQVRERRNRLLDSAAAAELSLTEGVREMRAIAGMTQEEFARHREVSARVIKAIELGQGNPTVATMNRIGQFFGLEVGFVPVRRGIEAVDQPPPANGLVSTKSDDADISVWEVIRMADEARDAAVAGLQKLDEMVAELSTQLNLATQRQKTLTGMIDSPPELAAVEHHVPEDTTAGEARTRTKRKPRSP